jgi:hypothetical protein
MKKVSAAVVKAAKNFPRPKLTSGWDLGDRSRWLFPAGPSGPRVGRPLSCQSRAEPSTRTATFDRSGTGTHILG